MHDLYLTVRSVTPAQKGRDALLRAGLDCRMLRAPRQTAPKGCGYALALAVRDGAAALRVLDRAGVRVEGVWRRLPEGGFERSGMGL